jgi:hypothetical protein
MYPKWGEKYCDDYKYDNCCDYNYMPKKYKMDCDYDYPKMYKQDWDMCCEMPKIPCKSEKKCVKTFKCTYKLYRVCRYRLYKVCPRCGHEYDYQHHRGLCPHCD